MTTFMAPARLLAALLVTSFNAQAIPMMTATSAPSRAKVIVEDFSGFQQPNYSEHLVIANGTVDLLSRIWEGDVCGDGNQCLGPVNEDWDVGFRGLPRHTLFWSTDFFGAETSFTTWTVTGRSGVSVFSDLSYRPNFAFFDPLGLLSIQLRVTQGFGEDGEPIIQYFRFDNITTISVPESGGVVVFCAGLVALLASRRALRRRM
jgi:hypothetical protein